MLSVTKLRKSFGARDLFVDAELQIYARDRTAIVGPNGSGKTTLVEILVGEQQADAGSISFVKGAVTGYLRQETDAILGKTLLAEVISAAEPDHLRHQLEVLEAEMAALEPGPERDRAVAEYGRLHERYEAAGGYSLEHEAKAILSGLGFADADFDRDTAQFSGGWRMRIALARLLVAAPDLLILDEPTNHLDLESVVWLERFLKGYEGAVILISHDRDLINGIANKIVEVRDRRLFTYPGDYENFVMKRELELAQQEAAARNQARKIAQTERFINRFRYKASLASRVQSRVKALEKIDRVEAPTRARKNMSLSFPTPPRSGRVVMQLEGVSFGYGDVTVYEDLDLVLERADKVALVGPNGAGKSTLLKLIAGVLTPARGERKPGHGVALGYFAQHQIEALQPTNTVLRELRSAIPPGADVDARKLLGRFLFSGDDVDKPVQVLSGGERTRVALAKLLVSPVNLLCLDEPTNHLDMWSRDVLEEALTEYSGGLVLITHDRHLIRSVANRILEVDAGRVTVFDGDYDYYLDKRAADEEVQEARPVSAAAPPARSGAGPKTKEQKRLEAAARAGTSRLRRRVTEIEASLDDLTARLRDLEKSFADPDLYQSGADVAELTRRYEADKRALTTLEQEWADALQQLDATEDA